MRAVRGARDMAAKCRRTAALDRRHHLQLAEAHMAGVGFAPRGSVAAENIRDLQCWTRHNGRASGGRLDLLELEGDILQRAHDLADRLVGHACVERRVMQLGMPVHLLYLEY